MIADISVTFPTQVLTNEALAAEFVDWTAESIFTKTGIRSRYIAGVDECASDFATTAAQSLLARSDLAIDWLLFCTQTPDYLLPTTACVIHSRLGLPVSCSALDFNLGCSGYVYGLSLATALIDSGQATKVLLLTGDTYSKLIDRQDRSTRTIFGDAGTATLLSKTSTSRIHSFVLGTDGSGQTELIVRNSALRRDTNSENVESVSCGRLYMNGPEIFNFTLKAVPRLVQAVLEKASMQSSDIDHYVFHQANGFMLEHLRRKIGIPVDKFALCLEYCGNTVSSTIPITLASMAQSGKLRRGQKILLAGFGVGYSWGGCILEW